MRLRSLSEKQNYYCKSSWRNTHNMATFTLEEVQKHTKPDDIWIVFHNKGWFPSWIALWFLY